MTHKLINRTLTGLAEQKESSERPKVSVCITTYNHQKFIAQAIQGVLDQKTNFKVELLIGEDESNDGTREICQQFADKYPDVIKLFLNKRKDVIYIDGDATGRGNFTNLIKHAQGDYLALHDGDDYWSDPLKLQLQVDFLDKHEDYSVCYHHVRWLRDGKLYDNTHVPQALNDALSTDDLFLNDNFIRTSAVMYRNHLQGNIPEWFYTVPYGDICMHLIHSQYGKIGYVDRLMGVYRVHTGGVFSGKSIQHNLKKSILTYQIAAKNLGYEDHDSFKIGLARLQQQLSNEISKNAALGKLDRSTKMNDTDKSKSEVLPITAIIAAYNEGDVIYHVIRDLVEQDIQVVFIDHHSTDNTLSEVKRWLGRGVIRIETFPDDAGMEIPDDVYSWRYILRRKQDIAKEMGPGWYIHTDADEFRESPWQNLNFRQGIERVHAEGFNAINFKIFDFKPTDDSFIAGEDIRDSLSYYDLDIHSFNTVQVKCWHNYGQAVNLWKSGGHDVSFEGRKIYPVPFILRHYAIRSQAHGLQKVFQDRKARFDDHERAAKWHNQYDEVQESNHQFVRDRADLVLWDRVKACESCQDIKPDDVDSNKYYQFSRPEIQALIDPSARSILDIGCAAGKMAAELKEKLGAEVWGIEPVATAAKQAAMHLDRVLVTRVDEALDDTPDNYFDAIIFADVLEHLADPYSTLKRISDKLKSQGEIIASIPNVRHWSVLKDLLEGRWDYQDAGILDRTHLRFFTKKSVADLFQQAGLDIVDISATVLDGQGAPKKVVKALANSGIDVSSLEEDSKHYQYLVTATPVKQVGRIQEENPLVSIIMLTWNALDFTKKCINSIIDHTHLPYEIIFVDNASTDGTQEYLRQLVKQHTNSKLIENSENKGFAAGNNQGVNLAGGKYVLLLNNDVLVADAWLDHLVQALELDEQIGMVGPITNHISGRQMIKDIPYTDDEGYDEFAMKVAHQNKGKITPRRRIAGFAMLMKRSLYKNVGGLDESFGIGNFEDDDLCLKIKATGLAIMVHEGVFLHHFGSQTFIANNVDYSATLENKGKIFREKWPDLDYDELIETKNPLSKTHHELYREGMDLLESSHYEAAYKTMLELVKENPLHEEALIALALSAKATEQSGVAMNSLRRLIKLNPHHAIALNVMGLVVAETGDLENAKKFFLMAMSEDKYLVDAQRNYAETLLMNDELQAGIQILVNILDKNPGDILSLSRMADLNLEAGRVADAESYAQKILEIDPENELAQQIIESLVS